MTVTFPDAVEYGAELVSRVFTAVRNAHGSNAAPEEGEMFETWVERMQGEGVLQLATRAELKDLRTYKDATAFVEGGGILLDPETGLSPLRDAQHDVQHERHGMAGIPVADRLAKYREARDTLQGRVVFEP